MCYTFPMASKRADGICAAGKCENAAGSKVYCPQHRAIHSLAMTKRWKEANRRPPCVRCRAPMDHVEETWTYRLCETCRATPLPPKPYVPAPPRQCKCGAPIGGTRQWCPPCSDKRFNDLQHPRTILYKYGVSYAAMMLSQGGACAICGSLPANGRKLQVDHDHDTGIARALLCGGCNTGIAHLKEDPVRLEKAAAYVRKHKTRPRELATVDPDRES